ncbi:hypothetical protein L1887_04963 [Cichorium endivia]|nr:hypothetical protein L1887_04963 [Cichorium endivia]
MRISGCCRDPLSSTGYCPTLCLLPPSAPLRLCLSSALSSPPNLLCSSFLEKVKQEWSSTLVNGLVL